jgi:trk system potassium uptake protein TrkA
MPRVVVIGLGRFGSACARRLYDQGAEVLGIDRSRAAVERAQSLVSAVVACDATDRANLEAYDVGTMDAAVVALADNFEASVLVTLHCRELGVPRVVAKAINPLQRRVLHEVGAHQVVMPEEEMGERLADHVLGESVVDFVELPDGYSLRRVPVPEEWAGRSLAELSLLGDRGLNVVQIVRPVDEGDGEQDDAEPGVRKIPLPHGQTVLQARDEIDVIGADENLRELRRT